jgi:hypothetical protein
LAEGQAPQLGEINKVMFGIASPIFAGRRRVVSTRNGS